MPIRIHSSNRVEKLQHSLCYELTSQPLTNPLAGEVILVPTFAMSRWLNLRVAQHLGVATNIEYPMPAAWLWKIAEQVIEDIPARDPLAAESMTWNIFSMLPLLTHKAELAELNQYLIGDDSGIKRWQLSVRIAEVFDRYQQYRPDVIHEWSAGKISDWQAILWQTLIEDLHGEHRVGVISRLIDRLGSSNPGVNLPERISLFAISSLPPLTLEVLLALSRHIDICYYLHSPSNQYFADLKSHRSLAKLGLSRPDEVKYYDTGNELLASWGNQAKSMQTLLLQQDYLVAQETESYCPPGNTRLLHSIQQNIFDLGATQINTQADDSISIHVCHSAMRECQVLYDQLLKILSDNPQLNAEDILVMVPEVSRYAPYIEAVFGYEDNTERPYLAWNLSDISIIDEHPLIQSFLQLLQLPNSRFEISEIMSLLEIPQIARQFELDEVAISDVLEWIEASNVRWGIDDKFKNEINQAATIQNTWLQARQRLFAGYALGDVRIWNNIAPLRHIDSNVAVNIGRFLNLFERLDYWRKQLQKSAGATEWVALLNQLMADFYTGLEPGEDYFQEIRDGIDALNLAGDCDMSSSLVRHWMQNQLGRQQRQGRLFSGGVTFCGMRPMRNLPFQVICLLGMNDNAFPRRPVSYDFDYLNRQHRFGDPSSADEDRYLMLETLLCARHTFYLSYTGRSLKDNSECQPSVLISEFIDFIDSQSDHIKLSDELVHLHPMQAFSADNFIAPMISYDASWCDVARIVRDSKQALKARGWPRKIKPVTEDERNEIDLRNLQRFLAHPIKYFFNTRLKVYFERNDEIDNDESFSLDALAAWQVKARLSADILKGQSDSYKVLRAEGLLPHGAAGSIEYEIIHRKQLAWLEQLGIFSTLPNESFSVNIEMDDRHYLYGEIANYYPGKGLMHYSASRLKGAALLKLWIDHLCLCATGRLSDSDSSYLIASDQTVTFNKLEPKHALISLLEYCQLFDKGQYEILPVFPKSSYAFALQPESDKALKKALEAWYSHRFNPVKGDEDDDYIQLAMRHCVELPLFHAGFSEFASMLYRQALKHMVVR